MKNQKNQKNKKWIIALLIITMMSMYGFLPPAQTANAVNAIIDAQDLISDSDLSVVATHTFTFTSTTTIPDGGYIEIDFPDGATEFSGLATTSMTCSYGAANITAQVRDGQKARCAMTGAAFTASSTQVVITSMTNPNTEETRYIEITSYNAADTVLDRVTVAVAIIEDILMTARVSSTLTFTISGMASTTSINGIDCDRDTTSTTTPFGTLIVNATSTVCQRLNVTTNADDGYTVTVEQDQELTSDSGSNINSFNNSPNDTGSTTAVTWASPTNDLDEYHTYGHMGLTSNDEDLSTLIPAFNYNNFYNGGGVPNYAGLNSTDPMPIMHHDGPSDGTTQNVGQADVAYSVLVASLQEAGDYENTLTYICTPTY